MEALLMFHFARSLCWTVALNWCAAASSANHLGRRPPRNVDARLLAPELDEADPGAKLADRIENVEDGEDEGDDANRCQSGERRDRALENREGSEGLAMPLRTRRMP